MIPGSRAIHGSEPRPESCAGIHMDGIARFIGRFLVTLRCGDAGIPTSRLGRILTGHQDRRARGGVGLCDNLPGRRFHLYHKAIQRGVAGPSKYVPSSAKREP